MFKVKDPAILTAALVLILGGLVFGLPASEYKETFEKTVPLSPGGSFSLENVNGGVSVSTWKENQVEIKAVKTAQRNESDLKEVEIVVEANGNNVMVKAVWPKFPRHVRVSVEFEIKVPEGVSLRSVETVNGAVDLTGSYASVKAETTNGRISAKDVSGNVSLETTNGAIEVVGLDGALEAETTNGGIRIEGLTFKGGVKAETTNGSITLGLKDPAGINAVLDAEVVNGGIEVSFPLTLSKISKKHIEARLGTGGPQIKLETTNGSIRITD